MIEELEGGEEESKSKSKVESQSLVDIDAYLEVGKRNEPESEEHDINDPRSDPSFHDDLPVGQDVQVSNVESRSSLGLGREPGFFSTLEKAKLSTMPKAERNRENSIDRMARDLGIRGESIKGSKKSDKLVSEESPSITHSDTLKLPGIKPNKPTKVRDSEKEKKRQLLKQSVFVPRTSTGRRQSFFQRIGLLRPVDDVPKSRQPLDADVKRSWTHILRREEIVLKDLDEKNLQVRDAHFHRGEELFDVFNIKGPMGKGLCIESSGVHVAFCAGTGVLVFLDLVSHLLLRAYYKHFVPAEDMPEQMTQLNDDFTFLFFVSMMSMDSEIGLNVCEALEKVNRKLGITNFKLTVRISKRWDGFRGAVWDQKFVEEQLSPFAGKIKKVWISGPPAMNETLDKSFEKLADKLKVSPVHIDAM